MFERLSKKHKIEFLNEQEENYSLYTKTKEKIDNQYDWNNFICILEDKNEIAQLKQIQNNWWELGTQVYDCRINDNDNMCPCLKHANDTTAYKCFRNYLERNELSPYDEVPYNMKNETKY